MPSSSQTPFPYGLYLMNPDNSNSANEILFQSKYTDLVKLMGVAPQFLTTFIDQTQSVSNWVGNSQWAANSMALAVGTGMTPVISLPLSSTAAGALSSDQQFQTFAAGHYDAVVQGVVQAWAQQGFKNLVIRPGWEMNIQGLTYAGDGAQSQADWVSAFKHVYTVLHQAAAANGVNVTVLWNPSVTNYTNASATTSLYPGNAYVDAIGADIYSDLHPFSDSSGTPTYHDWDTGQEDTSVAQFIADPVNRAHYWSDPAATKWSNDSSGGHSQSLQSLIQFAQANGKPFDIPETGAGNSNNGVDVNDDAAYPQWLSQQLAAAKGAGVQIGFVNMWDNNGGGNYEFSESADAKPNEAAAWAKYFGATPAAAAPVATPVATVADTLTLEVSEDAWQGDAHFLISIDGMTIGGVRTATASHAANATNEVSISGGWGSGPHTVGITFINDAFGGTASTDRNLYVDQVSYDGQPAGGAPASLLTDGTTNFKVGVLPLDVTLNLQVTEDAWRGDAQMSIAIDGQTLVSNQTVTALHTTGQSQTISVRELLSVGAHDLAISFLNDAWGGTAATDRNLYLLGAQMNATAITGAASTLQTTSTQHFQFIVSTT